LLIVIASCLAGTGCETPTSWSLPDSLPGTGAGLTAPRETVIVLAPRPLDDRAQNSSGPLSPRGGESAPIVWRASSQGVNGAAPDEPRPVLPASHSPAGPAHGGRVAAPLPSDLPTELNKVTLPPYRVEPPDILLIEAHRVKPRPDRKIEALDQVVVQAPREGFIESIAGAYVVGADGELYLGTMTGRVSVEGRTLAEAGAAISEQARVRQRLPKAPPVTVTLALAPAATGPHLVRMDGTVNLGVYGEVYVAGLTLAEARQAVEARLRSGQLDAQVTVDVQDSNSKVYYVIFDCDGAGQRVITLPFKGGETVLDAVSRAAQGLLVNCSTHRVWLARPAQEPAGCRQVLPVDWAAITEGAATCTNYEIFPGDRVYVRADHRGSFRNRISCLAEPLGRLFHQEGNPVP
jgi:polysaccharide export outer membrane protein